MKRFISALAFCVALLVLLSLFLFPPAEAKENVIMKLLNMPAPPPPNPLVKGTRERDQKFYDRNNPPPDDAPIEDLIDYWTNQGNSSSGTQYYNPRLSGRSLDRLMAEMARKPELASQLLDALPNDRSAVDAVKDLYDRADTEGGPDRDEQKQLRDWLRFNSPYFSHDLERVSQQIKDENNYVSQNNENNILALTRYDFDKASPILNQLYNDSSQPVSRALAAWALYRHALETDSPSDIERYRSELMHMVEDRNLSEGVRDKANDALMLERDFPGREDWAFSLFEDETLVNITRFTMITTLILHSPPEKYVPKMIALLQKSSSPTVRAAAVRNLVTALGRNPGQEMEIEIITSLLPWLEDAKWAADVSDSRALIVRKLIEYKIPESVPGLINVLDEKQRQIPTDARNGLTNAPLVENDQTIKNVIDAGIMKLGLSGIEVSVSNGEATLTGTVAKDRLALVMKAVMEADVKHVNNKLTVTNDGPAGYAYPYRQSAIAALGKQKDGRAVPALRKVLYEINGYERSIAVKAILDCGGFSVAEQMAGLDSAAKRTTTLAADYANRAGASANVPDARYYANAMPLRPATEREIKDLLGEQLMESEEISDELARAIVDRIEILDEKDPSLARAYRQMILKWQNSVINSLLLRDLRRDIADTDTIVRLLSQRKGLREKQSGDVADLRNGKPMAVGIAACIFEDPADYVTILENADAEAKTAMLACARLIRSPLPVAKVAEDLKSQNQTLQTAAERYLESEDSPEARGLVLARHQNEAKILGATSAFFAENASEDVSSYLWMLYQSLGDESLYNGWGGSYNDEEIKKTEKELQAEVKKDSDLLGVYAYDGNYIRIYRDRIIFSWDEDDSRYRERPLTKYEFDEIRTYFTENKVDELPPFLSCGGEYCSAKELVMLGRNGGRRLYMNSGSNGRNVPAFFAWLDKYFADLKLTKATLKYALSRDIPGLEILLASNDLHAETVWAQGNDVRVAVSDVTVRKKVVSEIEKLFSNDEGVEGDVFTAESETKKVALVEKRRYEGFAWYKVANGEAAGVAVQPPQVEFIPPRDALMVQPSVEQWKARAGDVEIRASGEGLFRVVRGKLVKLQKGSYDHLIISPNGRWVVAAKTGEDGGGIVRLDLLTNREFAVAIEGYGQKYPVAYIPTLNKFLLVNNERYYEEGNYGGNEADAAPDDVVPAGLFLLDAATGVVRPIAGEFRPQSQQTFRPLQNASKPNEFWAAMYDAEKKQTEVGIYDTKIFGFKPILHIPKIKFNSMSMWVDEAAGKVYFVYRGHLLTLPLGKQN